MTKTQLMYWKEKAIGTEVTGVGVQAGGDMHVPSDTLNAIAAGLGIGKVLPDGELYWMREGVRYWFPPLEAAELRRAGILPGGEE